MYDIHCHILPGVDDGSQNIRETEDLLRLAYREGIRGMIATPHYLTDMSDNIYEKWEQALVLTRQIAQSIDSGFEIHQGAEVFYSEKVLERLKNGAPLTLAKSSYILLEFPYDIDFTYMQFAINQFQNMGYLPIISHIERYQTLHRLDCVERLKAIGVLMQVNANTLLSNDFRTKAYVKKLIKRDFIDGIGTDSHNIKYRPPRMRAAYELLERKYSREYADRITRNLYKNITENSSL